MGFAVAASGGIFDGGAGSGATRAAGLPDHYQSDQSPRGGEQLAKAKSSHNAAITVFENSRINPGGLERTRNIRTWITGSEFNAKILRAHGIANPHVVLQGVDTSLFSPGERSGLWENHFLIFSGGKLEYRKGQDLVVAAVRAFRQRHPETILVFAWHNAWPLTMTEIATGGLVDGPPAVHSDGKIDFAPWLHKHGLPLFLDLGMPLNWHLPPLLREMDAAIFPSRCEGATNFTAMECLACGVPTILSANTGHLDIISDEICYPLKSQKPVRPTTFFPNVEGWGESSVDEIVQRLEEIYQNREEARRRAAAGVKAMQNLRWENQIPKILDAMGD